MNWDSFKYHFHPSWWEKMQPWIESDECNNIYKFLKSESQRGAKIAPLSGYVYKCFNECSFDDLKLVICGTHPSYAINNNGEFIADGLLLGCSNTGYVYPDLYKFYSAIESELFNGLNLNYTQNCDVSYLAKQGVLMLNSTLTTEIGKEKKHKELWQPFMSYLFKEVLSGTNVPILFLGYTECEKYTKNYSHVLSTSKHPSEEIEWNSEGVFTKINKILLDSNWYGIDWLDDFENPLF